MSVRVEFVFNMSTSTVAPSAPSLFAFDWVKQKKLPPKLRTLTSGERSWNTCGISRAVNFSPNNVKFNHKLFYLKDPTLTNPRCSRREEENHFLVPLSGSVVVVRRILFCFPKGFPGIIPRSVQKHLPLFAIRLAQWLIEFGNKQRSICAFTTFINQTN